MKNLFGVLVAGLLIAGMGGGCGVKTVRMKKFDYDRTETDGIEVFVDEQPPPDRKFEKLALLQEETGDLEDILGGFKRRAAQLGGNAIIVQGYFNYDAKHRDYIFTGKQTTHTRKESSAIVIRWIKP